MHHKKEFFMKNLIKLLGIIALVAVIGFTMIACDSGGGGGGGGGGGNTGDNTGSSTATKITITGIPDDKATGYAVVSIGDFDEEDYEIGGYSKISGSSVTVDIKKWDINIDFDDEWNVVVDIKDKGAWTKSGNFIVAIGFGDTRDNAYMGEDGTYYYTGGKDWEELEVLDSTDGDEVLEKLPKAPITRPTTTIAFDQFTESEVEWE
jgi:hypothetical protein